MTLAHARALLPSDQAHVAEYDRAGDDAALKRLAMWASRFSPIVAADAPDGLLLDITGCQRVHGGERRLVNTIANSLKWLGFESRVACASTFACAWALARFADEDRLIVEQGEEREALRDLPIQALNIDEKIVDGLLEVNVDRIGHLLDLQRNELADRFGQTLLLRLDQVLDAGGAMETIVTVRPTQPVRVERIFDGPVNQLEGILLTVRSLIEELCAQLAGLESGAVRIDLDVERIDAHSLRETISLSRPSRDVKHVWSLLQPRVEAIHLGFGVEGVALTAARLGRLPHEQDEHWVTPSAPGRSRINQAVGELIDAVAARMGADRALKVEMVQSHVPERGFAYSQVMNEKIVAKDAKSQASAGQAAVAAERPSCLFAEPELIDVIAIAPEGPPSWLRWRSSEHSVIASFGPERIASEWWRGAGVVSPEARDYFKVQINTGRWLWVFRQLDTRQWFVHGEWA